MTQRETETLARLTARVDIMAQQLDQNTKDTAAIKSTLDNLTGGKQALMWITGIIVSIGVIVATWLGAIRR